MACFTTTDIGGCGCSTPCLICPLPAANLTLSAVMVGGRGSWTGALVYTPGAIQTWAACVPLSLGGGSASHRFAMGCKPGICTYFDITNYTGANCTGTPFNQYGYNSDAGCTACNGVDPFCPGAPQNLQYQPASTCSPLNIILKALIGDTWTITP